MDIIHFSVLIMINSGNALRTEKGTRLVTGSRRPSSASLESDDISRSDIPRTVTQAVISKALSINIFASAMFSVLMKKDRYSVVHLMTISMTKNQSEIRSS